MARIKRRGINFGLVVAALASSVGVVWGGYIFLINPLLTFPLQYAAVDSSSIAPIRPLVIHLPTPSPVRGIYLTSWVAGTPRLRDHLIGIVDRTELNAVVIDAKDYSGRIAFAVADPELNSTGAIENRIPDIKELIADLHQRGIYIIGRVSVFQDAYFVSRHPELAVHRQSDNKVWKDRKGISWLEVGAVPVWDYVTRISRAAYDLGFDEINFDYVRFPSDGDMQDISYHYFDPVKETQAEALKKFYAYLSQTLAPFLIPISIDLFGLTTTSFDDLGIGQVLADAVPYFDYISPMVYPSHFAPGFLNFPNPATQPYEVVKHSMLSAVGRLTAASSTATKLRPWLQDFNLGATYTAEMVRAQIQATYDTGLDSWLLWDPNNRYTEAALEKQ